MNKQMRKWFMLLMILTMILSFGIADIYGEEDSRALQQETEEAAEEESEEETEEETEPEEDPEEEPSEEEARGNIRIRYIDSEGNPVGDSVLHQDLPLGEHSYSAKTISGYDLVSPRSKSVTLTRDGELLVLDFEYVEAPEEREEEPEEAPAEEEPAEEAPAPTPPSQAPAVKGTVVVQYLDAAGEEIRQEDIFDELPAGVHHFQAIEIEGYELSDEASKAMEITENGQRETISFTYTQTDELIDDEEEEEEEEDRRRGFFAWLWRNPIFGMVFLLLILMIIALIFLLRSLYKTRKKRRMDRGPRDAGEEKAPKGRGEMGAGGLGEQGRPGAKEGAKEEESPYEIVPGQDPSSKATEKKPSLSQKKRRRRAVLIIIGVLVAVLLLGYVGALYLLDRIEREEIARDDESLGIEEEGSRGVTNIAVFGIDSAEGMRGRSDAIMIVTLDENNDKIKITSIMRDSYVEIPGRGMDKVNHAYAFGGPELAIKTLNQNFRLDIRDFVSVNFNSMPAIIDAMGGIEQEITDREATQIKGLERGGTYTLTGRQALDFSRIRKIDSDFERTRRQRDVMEATIQKGLNAPVTSYPGMMNDIFPHMTTNMSSNYMLNMARKAVTQNIRTIEQVQFPTSDLAQGQMINGVYYYVFDRAEAANRLRAYLYEDQPMEQSTD
ncbi:LCP family protein [Isachenkonia alkalipeptolytica]|nr:LCP family protein [Isachenkonia alkalipeptolytica]